MAKTPALNVAIIGTKFMGKAHSNAWKTGALLICQPIPVLKVACGQWMRKRFRALLITGPLAIDRDRPA
jgi:hypothetical protein